MKHFNNILGLDNLKQKYKELAKKYGIKPHESAAWLDIISCVLQGIIPYGAHILLVCAIANVSPLDVIGKVYYCYILAFVTIM